MQTERKNTRRNLSKMNQLPESPTLASFTFSLNTDLEFCRISGNEGVVSIRDEIANLLDLTASHHLYLCKHAKLVLHNSQGQILCGHRDNDEWLDHRFSQFPNKHIVTQCQNRFPSATPPDTSETADTTSVVSSHYNRTPFTSQPLFRSIKLVVHTHKVPNNVATESTHGIVEDHLLQRPRSLLRFVPQVETHCRISAAEVAKSGTLPLNALNLSNEEPRATFS